MNEFNLAVETDAEELTDWLQEMETLIQLNEEA